MRLARSLIATAPLLTVLTALTIAPASARAEGDFAAHSHGNPNVDIDFSRACPDQNFPPRSLVARFFGVFNGGNARVVELRLLNNTPRQITLYGGVTIWGGNTTKREYVESLPPYGSVVKYPNVTLDSPNVDAAMDPSTEFVWPGIGCGRTWLKVFP